jgi:hypothetical protein
MYTVKESDIHGKGLFANRTITQGTVIGQLEGEPTTQDGPHVLWVTDEQGIQGHNDIRYVNHLKSANACYLDDASLIALRDITEGEEITHDYGEDWE